MPQKNDVSPQRNVPHVAIIVAMTRDRVIGSGEDLPWHLPEDLLLFKHLTMGCTIIMGRKTYTSIGRPLPGRHNIVLSRSQKKMPGVQVCANFMAGLTAAAQLGRKVFIIGGEELYRKALPIASELHISWVKGSVSGNVRFPELDLENWIVCESVEHAGFRYTRYQRKDNRCSARR
ncbi:MAG: dihydrofolate reductase [Desulfuromonadales bacterium]|nr:dihydrofolate reductase [Desulfuromonadales bacterium]